jgi:hypothetical protein
MGKDLRSKVEDCARSEIGIRGSFLSSVMVFVTGAHLFDRRYGGPTRANSWFEFEGARLWLGGSGCSINRTG